MTFSNPLLVELVVPKSQEVDSRIRNFYKNINWDVRDDTVGKDYTYVQPKLVAGVAPMIVYGQNPDPKKTEFFVNQKDSMRSQYCDGVTMPFEFDLVEICMALPTNSDVVNLYEQGGELLQKHIKVPLREYYGVQEFRFVDPFNYVIRITVDPGWEK